MNEKQIYMMVLNTWGANAQITMVFEEMSELQKELCKSLRGKDNSNCISEEIADVLIMLEQMIVLYNCKDEVQRKREYKLHRLADRLGVILE